MKLISEGENTLVVLGLCSDVNGHKHINTEVLYSVATYHGVNLHLKILLVYSTLIVCLLLTRKLLKLKSSLRKFYGRSHDLINRYRISVSQMTTHMFHLYKHFPVVSSFMTNLRVCNESNTTGATIGTGTAYPSGSPEFTSIFSFLCSIL